MKKNKLVLVFLLCILFPSMALGEYRSYMLEVYDHVSGKKWTTVTGLTPQKYMHTHGGAARLTAILLATWHCYGNTAQYLQPCKKPAAKAPIYKTGDLVEVTLKKHVTYGWRGIVIVSLYRQDWRSNVYGIRFSDRRRSYARYFEFNLKKISDAADLHQGKTKLPPPSQEDFVAPDRTELKQQRILNPKVEDTLPTTKMTKPPTRDSKKEDVFLQALPKIKQK